MSSLRLKISAIVSAAFGQCGYDQSFGAVVDSQRPDLGQFQCNGAMSAAKAAKKNPRAIAQDVVAVLKANALFRDVSIAGAGFINISVTDDVIADHFNQIHGDDMLGCLKADTPETVVIDFGSPNVAKPMHVGHLRSAIIGDSLKRLFSFSGHHVIGDNHIGDWGTQMGMLICELKEREPSLPYFDPDYTGDYPKEPPLTIQTLESLYPVASKRCKEDEALMALAVAATDELQQGRRGYVALWKHFVNLSLETLKQDFDELGVRFDHWYGESFYHDRMGPLVEKLRAQGFAQVSEGALVMAVSEPTDTKEVPPLMLVKSGGGFLYATSDLATIEFRMQQFKADRILYVVDLRQGLHFVQVFRAARKTGIAKPQTVLEHIGFGTVNGPDGKPFKTRAGGVMKLCDLIEQVTQKAQERMKEAEIAQDVSKEEYLAIARMVGIAALKFADLANHRTSDYVFDIDKFTRFEGKTGPYLLYAAVRIKSILRKAKQNNLTEGAITPPSDTDRQLMLMLAQLPDVIQNAQEGYAPSYLCDFAYNLAQEFNRFYTQCHILREQDQKKQCSWLALSSLCLKELELLLQILGMQIPERM